MTPHYTLTQAAARVKRSRRTIENWVAEGMTVTMITHGARRTQYVEEAELLKWLRTKIINNPSRPTNTPQNEERRSR